MSARLLFIGMLNFSDDNGNQAHSAKRLKMQIFPADVIDVAPLLAELVLQGVVIEYMVKGEKYLHIKGFCKHQVINRPSRTDIPLPECASKKPKTHGVLPVATVTEGKGREGKELTSAFASFWEQYPRKKNKGHAEKAFDKLKPDDELLQTILKAVEGARESADWRKDGGQFIPHPATWLNARGWEDGEGVVAAKPWEFA